MLRNRFGWLWIWGIAAMISVSSGSSAKHPHIVFIMVDDMGWNDVSFHGSDQIQTPNIDSLAYQGVVLQQYYSEAICTPARTALLTGKYPMRLGMQGRPLANAEDRGIPLTERLLPSYLKNLGYATHLVGKWHAGMSKTEFLPTYRGYDSHYGLRGGFIDYYTHDHIETTTKLMFGLDFFDNEIPKGDEQSYVVDALTDRAIKIINKHNMSQPLFLHLAHNAPHASNAGAPLQPPLYTTLESKHIANSDRRLYAEIVRNLDLSIGKLIKALAKRKILDNTIIAFMSDNGAPTIGEFTNWGVNLPFRGIKETPWEGAVRVPAFIWHTSLKPRVWNGLMHITDWLPTLIAAAGGQVDAKIDGVNQWDSIVHDVESPRKEVLLTIEENQRISYASYRSEDYKIVLGNVTGLSNGYYLADYLVNKKPPSDYYSAVKSCDVSSVFTAMGKFLNKDTVSSRRKAMLVKQEDFVADPTPCEPTPTRGCLYNIRKDPEEKHDLWEQESKIATLLKSKLEDLTAQQMKRGPTNIGQAADPANFGYIWLPWVNSSTVNS